MMRRPLWIVAALIASLFLSGCASQQGVSQPTKTAPTAQAARPSAQVPCGVVPDPPHYDHVIWLIMENHGPDQVVSSPDALYLNSLIGMCGLATNSHAVAHPSLPNYIAMTSGDTQAITDDAPPADHPVSAASIFSQLGADRWRSLSESMPANCYKQDSGTYAPRHNPPTYYTSLDGQCPNQAVPLGHPPDISAPFTLIVPDQKSNTHDTDVAFGDTWLAGFMPTILDSTQYREGRTVVVITYDEDENEGNPQNPITTVVISPSTGAGIKDSTYYTHYSLLRTTEELLGLDLLGHAADATSMRQGFNI